MNQPYQSITGCRVSASASLETILEMGLQPLANAFKKGPDYPELKIPLSLLFCPDSGLIQIRETVDKEALFKNYVWVSGTAAGTRDYARLFASRAQAVAQKSNGFVVEVASNDGTFLSPFQEDGWKVLGVDPASNIAKEACARGIETWDQFWDESVAKEVFSKRGKADLVIARNVLPHVSELSRVVQGLADVLDSDGVAVVEFHDAGIIMKELHYDSIYHEHLCYFSIASLSGLLERHGLYPFHLDRSPISGGSRVLYLRKYKSSPSPELIRAQEEERDLGVLSLQGWRQFSDQVQAHRLRTLDILRSFEGKKVAAFGASARSSTYLNYCGLGASQIPFLIDNNPMKQGYFSPGGSIPIVSLERGLAQEPEVLFLTAWNFAGEIMELCRTKGFQGQFLIPFPNEPRLIR